MIVEADEDGVFVAECLDLPGCVTQGTTADEALENLKDAASGYLKSLEKHNESIPRQPAPGCADDVETKPPQITCLDCGKELRPEDQTCPACGSRNRKMIARESITMREMATVKQKAKGFKNFKVKQKQGYKMAGESGCLAEEFLVLDKVKNLKCHVVAEKGESCQWRLVHFEVCPLDPSDPIASAPTEGPLPFEVDVCTEKHIVLRSIVQPHHRLTVPRELPSFGCARRLFACAGLPLGDFGRLLLRILLP